MFMLIQVVLRPRAMQSQGGKLRLVPYASVIVEQRTRGVTFVSSNDEVRGKIKSELVTHFSFNLTQLMEDIIPVNYLELMLLIAVL